ncbi:hypothetical protein N7471_000120 [Penicillium samsonianum]|uniref:uncharacterized protein n=1 Tax=Penicillium samsonianum TaxID=1882272 RepID=UPI0025491152|nr:uncharacterized protein N7471_000120 [Penicillium samsonianum]KAJ6148921.1 hypothetical protein N7471_000120 [Penicillium samsonianum]
MASTIIRFENPEVFIDKQEELFEILEEAGFKQGSYRIPPSFLPIISLPSDLDDEFLGRLNNLDGVNAEVQTEA